MMMQGRGQSTPTADPAFEMPPALMKLFDPAPELQATRERQPICRLQYAEGPPGWLVTGHALGRSILSDPRFSVSQVPARIPVDDGGAFAAMGALPPGLLSTDPPDHKRLRQQLTGYFTVRRLGERRASLEAIVNERLDAMEDSGPPVELLEAFALPIASMALCDLLGVPRSDGARFAAASAVVFRGTQNSADEKRAALQEFYEYVHAVIEQKRAHPDDGVISRLATAGEVTDRELAGLAWELFLAGHHTTASMIALSVFFLLYDRDRWERLRAEPTTIEDAVEELLRYLTISPVGIPRTALEDVEIEGTVIRRGESVLVNATTANRDPFRFADADRFDPTRDSRGHMQFGHGRHMCLGQHLARLELQVALQGLMKRFPKLHIAGPVADIHIKGDGTNPVSSTVERLPVAW
jgi:cytochrome P450